MIGPVSYQSVQQVFVRRDYQDLLYKVAGLSLYGKSLYEWNNCIGYMNFYMLLQAI